MNIVDIDNEIVGERFELIKERIGEIAKDCKDSGRFADYFTRTASFITLVIDVYEKVKNGFFETASADAIKEIHDSLYEDILGEAYENSYANPEYAVRKLGEEFGPILGMLLYEMRGMIAYAYEGRKHNITILCELFVQIYNLFEDENVSYDEVREAIYYFFFDYSEVFAADSVMSMIDPKRDFFKRIIMDSDLSDTKYLYKYGSYIGENELGISRYLAALDDETIKTMADTFTGGYIKGFEVTNKPLHKKKTCMIYYPIGFERVIKKAIENFEKQGLDVCIFREKNSSCESASTVKNGAYSTSPNRQYDYDHQFDMAFYFDKTYARRRNEVKHDVFVKNRELASYQAGPAVMEVFGESLFSPKNKPQRKRFDEKQQALFVEYMNDSARITNEYIIGDERSYTIIAFPLPEIGERFADIFADTIKLNTLDYNKYHRIQECIIDVLDKGDFAHILGTGKNKTDLKVNLYKLTDPDSQTIFENCVADVNIPVGEVFTSPVLAGTTGKLHVSRVFLNGLEYRELEIDFKDGMITDYTCKNFDDEDKNKEIIKENILHSHDTLTMGEFAIGTNTVAYKMARDYGIEALLPILIAEKTGPHFAVGDTCYSHSEDVRVFNPNGKEIVARDNEHTLIRKSDPKEAYYNCHTDITIPYDELGSITVTAKDGTQYDIIRDGRFVVPGTEELNEPIS